MKLWLFILGLFLSVFEYSFGAEALSTYKQSIGNLRISSKLVNASTYLNAAYKLGELRRNPRLLFPSIGEDSLCILNTLVSLSSAENFSYLRGLSHDDLALAAISAETLRLEEKFQNIINRALTQKLCADSSDAASVENILVPYPISKLSVIETIIKDIPYKRTYSAPTITGISLNPAGTKLLTLHKDAPVALWDIEHRQKTLTKLTDLLTIASRQKLPTKQAFFSAAGNYICLVSDDAIVMSNASTLEPEYVHHKEVPEDSFKTVVYAPDDLRYTLLSTASPAETFDIAGRKMETATPDGDNGIFDCFTYHPEHHYNALVATFNKQQPAIKLWNLFTGAVIKYFQVHGDNPTIQQLILRDETLLAQELTKVIEWNIQSESKKPQGTITEECSGEETIKFFGATNDQSYPIKRLAAETTKHYTLNKDFSCGAIADGEKVMIQFEPKPPKTIMAALALRKDYRN